MLKKCICLLSLCGALTAQAYDYSGKFGLGLGGGATIPSFGNQFNDVADPELTGTAYARYHFSQAFGLDAAYTRNEFQDTNMAMNIYDLLGFYRFMPTEKFSPVFGLGAGAVDLDKYEPTSMKLGLRARLGIEYALNEAFSLAGHVDYHHISKIDNNLPIGTAHVIAPKVALTWYFGSEKKEAKNEVKQEIITAMKVDTDNDGIMDADDKCPDSPQGEAVNAFGCGIKEKAEVKIDVEFATGKAVIDHKYDEELKNFADFMNKHPEIKAVIGGHTDNVGSAKVNTAISHKRAEAVVDYLVRYGSVKAERLTAEGFGPAQPIADNKTAEGRAHNRRVVAVISTEEGTL